MCRSVSSPFFGEFDYFGILGPGFLHFDFTLLSLALTTTGFPGWAVGFVVWYHWKKGGEEGREGKGKGTAGEKRGTPSTEGGERWVWEGNTREKKRKRPWLQCQPPHDKAINHTHRVERWAPFFVPPSCRTVLYLGCRIFTSHPH